MRAIPSSERVEGTAATEQPPNPTASSVSSWRIADLAVLGLWVMVATFTLLHHEKWADEAQAWLVARDLDLRAIWFHELRYEGSPGLWHTMLWVAQHVFHANYGALGFIGLACATAGVALLLFKAPFPRVVRWPLAFTYFMIYQYAVIARPYTLLPLLAFAAAIQFKDLKHPERMTLVLVLLANLSLHGLVLAACLGLAYLVEAVVSWSTLDAGVRKRYVLCIAGMALMVLFLYVILKPTPDVEVFAQRTQAASPAGRAQFYVGLWKQLAEITSGAFFDHIAPSVLFLGLAGAWCWMRRKFLVFALPVGAMLALYGVVYGYVHHQGTVFIAAIAALWIAWPTAEEQRAFRPRERWATEGMIALLLCLCAAGIWDAAGAINNERLYPYSGAEDAAKYLKSVGADRGAIFGYVYGVVAVQAYFDHNIFANRPTAYFHHGLPLDGNNIDLDELNRVSPEYLVVYSTDPKHSAEFELPPLEAQGFQVVHFSDGYYLYKRSSPARQSYFILRRVAVNTSR